MWLRDSVEVEEEENSEAGREGEGGATAIHGLAFPAGVQRGYRQARRQARARSSSSSRFKEGPGARERRPFCLSPYPSSARTVIDGKVTKETTKRE